MTSRMQIVFLYILFFSLCANLCADQIYAQESDIDAFPNDLIVPDSTIQYSKTAQKTADVWDSLITHLFPNAKSKSIIQLYIGVHSVNKTPITAFNKAYDLHEKNALPLIYGAEISVIYNLGLAFEFSSPVNRKITNTYQIGSYDFVTNNALNYNQFRAGLTFALLQNNKSKISFGLGKEFGKIKLVSNLKSAPSFPNSYIYMTEIKEPHQKIDGSYKVLNFDFFPLDLASIRFQIRSTAIENISYDQNSIIQQYTHVNAKYTWKVFPKLDIKMSGTQYSISVYFHFL